MGLGNGNGVTTSHRSTAMHFVLLPCSWGDLNKALNQRQSSSPKKQLGPLKDKNNRDNEVKKKKIIVQITPACLDFQRAAVIVFICLHVFREEQGRLKT